MSDETRTDEQAAPGGEMSKQVQDNFEGDPMEGNEEVSSGLCDWIPTLADQAVQLDGDEAELAKRRKALEAAEADLAERERLAGVKAKQLEVDEREEALKQTDKMIDAHQSGETAKPGDPFIDRDGIQHRGNCNSHPSKRVQMQCDCGHNGTSRSLPRNKR